MGRRQIVVCLHPGQGVDLQDEVVSSVGGE